MTEKLRANVRTPDLLFGGEIYTVFVDITNLSDNQIDGISVTENLIPGVIFEPDGQPENVELTQLETKKRQLSREMEAQIALAYERKVLKELTKREQYIAIFSNNFRRTLRAVPLVSYLSILKEADAMLEELSVISVPSWAREALRIEDWEDIERLEKEIIQNEPENSFLRTTYSINKAKLRKVLSRLQEAEDETQSVSLKDVYLIQPSETIIFHFKGRVPFVFRVRNYPLKFTISYRDIALNTIGSFSVSDNITFNPSPTAIGLGAFVGAITGFVIKVSLLLQQDWSAPSFWFNFLGSILFAIVITFLTARTADSKKPITVEDFIGGFIVGALTVLFFESVMDKLRAIIQSV